jgi:hypothetical protein
MPINAFNPNPSNRLAYPDSIGPVPRNEYLGALADFLAKSYSPERTQQMQGISQFLNVPAVSRTLDMLSYGEPLTTGAGGLGGTTRPKADVVEAALTVAPLTPAAALQSARLARQAALAGDKAAMAVGKAGERYAERVVPQVMARGGMPAQLAQDLAQGTRRQIFIGENSKTWNKTNAAKAVELEKAGAKPEDIWMATGTFRGPEGKLRQEISDEFSVPKGMGNFEDIIMKAYTRGVERTGDQLYKTNVNDVLLHNKLNNAYPNLMGIETQMMPKGKTSKGSFAQSEDSAILHVNENLPSDESRSVILHELQHAIQDQEGFAQGGDPRTMILTLEKIAEQKRQQAKDLFSLSRANDPLDPTKIVKPGARKKGLQLEKEAQELDSKALMAYHSEQAKFDLYQRLAGEAEARAVQSRMNMSPQDRRATYPYQSYDVPLNQLIVRTK